MKTNNHFIYDKQSILKLLETKNIDNIKVAVCDLDGILRGKYINKNKFKSVLDKGMGFCDVIFGWDSHDDIYPQDSFTGWRDAFPDAWAYLDKNSLRFLPTEDDKSIILLGDFSKDEKTSKVCPRSLLKKVLSKAKKMGYDVFSAAEFEFFLFEEDSHSIIAKQYQNLKNITPGMFGYSVLRNSTHASFYHELMDMCSKMQMPIEGLHTETGPGVIEAAIEYSEALQAADNAVLFKTFTKVLAKKFGWMATFMAKFSAKYPGQSGHLHISLTQNGENVFYDKNDPDELSQTARHFIGGQQQLMPELLAMVASTCNSYTRLIPGFWAPTDASWGVDNRTCALRAIPGGNKATRVEYRVSAADINPYLALSAAIASGLWGIENKIEPSAPIVGNAYVQKHDKKLALPMTLKEAAIKLKNSKIAKELFGKEFVEHYAYTRACEYEEQRKAITNWQLERYFEII